MFKDAFASRKLVVDKSNDLKPMAVIHLDLRRDRLSCAILANDRDTPLKYLFLRSKSKQPPKN